MKKILLVFMISSIIISCDKERLHREYFENGELKSSGNYINNIKDGDWKWYSDDGKLNYQATYENGTSVSYILWDQKGDDCNHDFWDAKSIYSWDEDPYFFSSRGITVSKESSIMNLNKCNYCDKYSGRGSLKTKAYYENSTDLYIPDNKIMSLTVIYKDSTFNFEESKIIPIYDTLQFNKSSPSDIKIKVKKNAGTTIIYPMDNNGALVYSSFEFESILHKRLLNPSRDTYAIDKIFYEGDFSKTCINPIYGKYRPSITAREESKFTSDLNIDLWQIDYILEKPPEKILIRYRKNADGSATVISY